MICTCSHNNMNSNLYATCSISGNRGKDVDYKGKCYPKLAPKLSFWKVWHDNIGKISEEENNRYYVEEYWNQVLSKLDPEEVYRELDGSVLLCYEDNDKFCHRHIVAAWLEILLGKNVPEVKVDFYTVTNIKKPKYIKEYLDYAMRKNKNMRGFTSLRAVYLFEKGEELERKANELEDKTGEEYFDYRQTACYLRCEANMAEDEYRLSKKKASELKKELRKIKRF